MRCVTFLILQSSAYPTSITMSTPPSPASSNTVLFEMVMFYKAQLESSQAEGRLMHQRLADQQAQIHQLITNNNLLTAANQRGANLVNMKHEAGVMFGQCTDRFADLCGTMRREIPEVLPFCPEIERILLRADFAHHMLHGVNFVDLTADEELSGEETETDDEI
jgi:hypothetical protein